MDIALYQPEIPPNTGNIGRLCYCTNSRLHIIGKPSFSLDEAAVRRAGLDYWAQLNVQCYDNWNTFRESFKQDVRILLFTRFSKNIYSEYLFESSDVLVFGSETKGLPVSIQEDIKCINPFHLLSIPVSEKGRSLNLSNAVAIVLYEALRQQNFSTL